MHGRIRRRIRRAFTRFSLHNTVTRKRLIILTLKGGDDEPEAAVLRERTGCYSSI